jgi:hypothetical protein
MFWGEESSESAEQSVRSHSVMKRKRQEQCQIVAHRVQEMGDRPNLRSPCDVIVGDHHCLGGTGGACRREGQLIEPGWDTMAGEGR